MRMSPLLAFCLVACATGGSGRTTAGEDTLTSIVSVAGGVPRVISVQAGPVRLRHTAFNGRLTATTLKGIDPANQHLEYRWTSDGTYEVEVSGRYEHRVLGAVISGGRVESRLTYRVLPDSLRWDGET